MEKTKFDKFMVFLKDLPDKYILIIVLLIMLGVAMRFGAIEPREIWLLVRDVTIAIISIAGYKRMSQSQEIAPEELNINTEAINNEQMNDATINVGEQNNGEKTNTETAKRNLRKK